MKVEDRISELEKELEEEIKKFNERKESPFYYSNKDKWLKEFYENTEKIKLKIANTYLMYLKNLKYLKDISLVLLNIRDLLVDKKKPKKKGGKNEI